MMRAFRFSMQAALVAHSLLESPNEWTYGYDLMGATGLGAGTLYPLLRRFTDHGWLRARWEERGEDGRPPRHLYKLTADGVRGARELVARARAEEARAEATNAGTSGARRLTGGRA